MGNGCDLDPFIIHFQVAIPIIRPDLDADLVTRRNIPLEIGQRHGGGDPLVGVQDVPGIAQFDPFPGFPIID